MRDSPKTYRIKSFGCQMNVYDGERMAELLGAQGMTAASEGEDADLVVLNTCHIREKAAQKAYSEDRPPPRGAPPPLPPPHPPHGQRGGEKRLLGGGPRRPGGGPKADGRAGR